MKKVILLFAFLFTVSSSFISCRETTNDQENVENDVENTADEVGDEVEEGADEVDEEF